LNLPLKLKSLLPYIALLSVSIIYGASYVVAKGVMPNIIGPSGFIMLRAVGAAVLFWIILLMRWELPAKKDILRLAVCGMFGVAVNQLFFFNGLNLTSAMNSSIIITTNPIMVLIIAALFLGEKITLRKGVGVILGFIGAILLIWLGSQNKDAGTSIRGDLFILINSMSYAIYLVTVKPLMSRYRPLTVIAWVFLFGMLYVIPFGYSQFTEVDWSALNGVQFRSIAFVVLFATFGVYLLNVYALKSVSPSVVSSFIYLQPVMAGIFSWIFFSLGTYSKVAPDFSWGMVGATGLIFIGVWLVSRKKVKLLEP
jgi:drug/metabolite transporter (DMT)-like permease